MERNIPDFMKKYHEGSDEEGKEHINRIAARYEDERQMFFQTTFNEKHSFQNDWNRTKGDRTRISHEEAIQPLNQMYEKEVKATAVNYGYVEQDEQQAPTPENTESQAPEAQDSRQAARDKFLQNLQSIREKSATQTHRPRH